MTVPDQQSGFLPWIYRAYNTFPFLNRRAAFLKSAPPYGKWLDIGSGTGLVFRNLHALRSDLSATATDIRDYAQHFQGHENEVFVQIDAEHWPFPDDHFDVLTSFHVLEHMGRSGRDRFYSEMTRVLKPGGRFYLETPSHRSTWLPPIKSPHGPTNFWQDPTHVEIVNPKEFQEVYNNRWNLHRVRVYRNWLYVLAAPVLLPVAFFPPGNLAYHYLMPNLVGWSIYAEGAKR